MFSSVLLCYLFVTLVLLWCTFLLFPSDLHLTFMDALICLSILRLPWNEVIYSIHIITIHQFCTTTEANSHLVLLFSETKESKWDFLIYLCMDPFFHIEQMIVFDICTLLKFFFSLFFFYFSTTHLFYILTLEGISSLCGCSCT